MQRLAAPQVERGALRISQTSECWSRISRSLNWSASGAMISYLAIGHFFHAALATPFQTTAKSGSLMYLTFKSTNLMSSTKCPVTLFGTTIQVLVKNLAFAKQVAIVYSVDNW